MDMIKSFSWRRFIFLIRNEIVASPQPKADVGVVAVCFGQFADLLHKCQRFTEVSESEGPLKAMGIVLRASSRELVLPDWLRLARAAVVKQLPHGFANLAPRSNHAIVGMQASENIEHIVYQHRRIVAVLDDEPRRHLPYGDFWLSSHAIYERNRVE
jgi:hypothetical protein